MATNSDKLKTNKSEKKYSVINKKKKLLTSEFKKVIGGKRIAQEGIHQNHNELFLIA